MLRPIDTYDFLVIGGGIFGVYAALYLSGRGLRVLLVEKEKRLFSKASLVNQARLHSGYHYPRSVATAVMSDENKARFMREHRDFIHTGFDQYYAIDAYNSLTDARQFERFCAHIGIPCRFVPDHPRIDTRRLEALYRTEEYTFDPVLIARFYAQKLEDDPRIDLRLGTVVRTAEKDRDCWRVELKSAINGTAPSVRIQVGAVINATYAASNTVNTLFGQTELELMHEISEMAFLHSPGLGEIGLTIMDGQFASLMPYGKTGMLSLSSVAYTHHKVSYNRQPRFSCQEKNPDCRPDRVADCSFCPVRPVSNHRKMMAQIRQYLKSGTEVYYYFSLYTVKSKLRASYIDDGRPTEVRHLQDNPAFYCIFAGKINSIYEVEKVLKI